jgi:hypothetical protein
MLAHMPPQTRLFLVVSGAVAGVASCIGAAQEPNPMPAPSLPSPPRADPPAHYSLLHPRPADQLRDMSTDRPDTTESPYTVDVGHYQFELSLVDFTADTRNDDGVRTGSLAVAPMLLKAGILDNMDLQLGIDPYTRERQTDKTTNAKTTVEGFGDLTLRVKINLWGNDKGDTALAIMPFIKFPTATGDLGNGKIEGGLILPLAVDLGNEVSLGLMQEFDAVRTDSSDRYSVDWVHTVTVGFPIAGELGGYVEFAGFANLSHSERYRGYADAGVTYGLTPDVQLDAGLRIGVTKAADDLGLFLGVSYRY